MQVIRSKTKVLISKTDLKNALNTHFGLQLEDDFEFEITNDIDDTVSVHKEDEQWIDVPIDWYKCNPPFDGIRKVEVIQRNGKKTTNYSWFSCWYQDEDKYDIVKYRFLD